MSVYDSYLTDISENLKIQDPLDMNFKSKDAYNQILEHVTYDLGCLYIKEIMQKFNVLFTTNKDMLVELCKKNDLYGKTKKYTFDGFATCSSSNLRYIFHSFLILDWMVESGLNNIDVIEIGAGYGGLCFFIHNLAHLFQIKVRSYTTFDLFEATKLQEKYLKLLDVQNVQCFTIDNFQNINTNSFLISNYAFSEIPMNLQEEYTIKILNPYVKFGFLAWNTIEVYNFMENSIINVEEEYPKSGNFNFYVRVSPKK
jgi:hypothetical protein